MKNLNPIVCTLTSAQLARRGARWKETLQRYAARIRRLPDGVSIEFDAAAPWDELRELVRLESDCCKWMDLDLHETASPPTLTISAGTDEGVETIARMVMEPEPPDS